MWHLLYSVLTSASNPSQSVPSNLNGTFLSLAPNNIGNTGFLYKELPVKIEPKKLKTKTGNSGIGLYIGNERFIGIMNDRMEVVQIEPHDQKDGSVPTSEELILTDEDFEIVGFAAELSQNDPPTYKIRHLFSKKCLFGGNGQEINIGKCSESATTFILSEDIKNASYKSAKDTKAKNMESSSKPTKQDTPVTPSNKANPTTEKNLKADTSNKAPSSQSKPSTGSSNSLNARITKKRIELDAQFTPPNSTVTLPLLANPPVSDGNESMFIAVPQNEVANIPLGSIQQPTQNTNLGTTNQLMPTPSNTNQESKSALNQEVRMVPLASTQQVSNQSVLGSLMNNLAQKITPLTSAIQAFNQQMMTQSAPNQQVLALPVAIQPNPAPAPSAPSVQQTPNPAPSAPPVQQTPNPALSAPPVQQIPNPAPSAPPVQQILNPAQPVSSVIPTFGQPPFNQNMSTPQISNAQPAPSALPTLATQAAQAALSALPAPFQLNNPLFPRTINNVLNTISSISRQLGDMKM